MLAASPRVKDIPNQIKFAQPDPQFQKNNFLRHKLGTLFCEKLAAAGRFTPERSSAAKVGCWYDSVYLFRQLFAGSLKHFVPKNECGKPCDGLAMALLLHVVKPRRALRGREGRKWTNNHIMKTTGNSCLICCNHIRLDLSFVNATYFLCQKVKHY